MADYPCDSHNGRYPGESTRAYLRLYQGEQTLELKLSLCGQCLELVLEPWATGCLGKGENGYWVYAETRQDLEPLWKARSEAVEAFRAPRRV